MVAFAVSACSTVKSGGGEAGPISGAAVSNGDGQKTTSSGSTGLKPCSKNYGRLAIEEPPASQTMYYPMMGISSPLPLARHAAMQSGCFTLVDRGASFAMGEKERQISGEKGGSTQRKTVTARWALKVEVPQPTTQTGHGVGAIAAMIPGIGGLIGMGVGAVAGSVKFSEAQVVLTIIDLETSEVLFSVTGTGKSTDMGFGGAFLGGIAGIGGGSSQTPEMKVVAAGFVDAFNQMIPLMDRIATATPAPEVIAPSEPAAEEAPPAPVNPVKPVKTKKSKGISKSTTAANAVM